MTINIHQGKLVVYINNIKNSSIKEKSVPDAEDRTVYTDIRNK